MCFHLCRFIFFMSCGHLLRSFRSLRGYLPDSYGVIWILDGAFIGADGHLSVFQWRRVVLESVPFLIWPMISRWSYGGSFETNTHFGLLSWNLNTVKLSIQVWFNFAILPLLCREDYALFIALLNLIFVGWLDRVVVVSSMIAGLTLCLSFILILRQLLWPQYLLFSVVWIGTRGSFYQYCNLQLLNKLC